MSFCYSLLTSETDTHPKRIESDWSTFCAEVLSCPEPRGNWPLYEYLAQVESKDKARKARAKKMKSGRAWCPATFGTRPNEQGSLRHDGNVLAMYAGVADIDNKIDELLTVPDIEARLKGYTFALHTSYSHTPGKPRYRVIIPLAHPMPPADMPRLFAYFRNLFGSALDEACKNPSRLYYTPSYPPDAEEHFVCKVAEGKYFDPDRRSQYTQAGSGEERAEQVDLKSLRVSNKIKRLIAEGMSEEYQDDRSRACAAVISAIFAAGYDSMDVVDVLMNPAHGISARPREIGFKRLLEDIKRLRAKGRAKRSGPRASKAQGKTEEDEPPEWTREAPPVEAYDDEQHNDSRLIKPYTVSKGAIHWLKQVRDGCVPVPLCDFTARIRECIHWDDGAEAIAHFVIEGETCDGRKLPAVEVPSSSFASLNWVTTNWTTDAFVFAGQSIRDHLRAAIQALSGRVNKRSVYGHLGWRRIEDARLAMFCFLRPTGRR